MANTYTQLGIQIVFAVKYRRNAIPETYREALQRFMTGIVQRHGHRLLQIYCMPDHTHIVLELHPAQALSDLVRNIKTASSKWVTQQGFVSGKFAWQAGYGAFSYHRDLMPTVIRYVANQAEHHRQTSFKTEYQRTLKEFEVDYQEEYLFDW
ncbi:MAG: IS200/IS605 family transposase [Bacteroidota bacterium]